MLLICWKRFLKIWKNSLHQSCVKVWCQLFLNFFSNELLRLRGFLAMFFSSLWITVLTPMSSKELFSYTGWWRHTFKLLKNWRTHRILTSTPFLKIGVMSAVTGSSGSSILSQSFTKSQARDSLKKPCSSRFKRPRRNISLKEWRKSNQKRSLRIRKLQQQMTWMTC